MPCLSFAVTALGGCFELSTLLVVHWPVETLGLISGMGRWGSDWSGQTVSSVAVICSNFLVYHLDQWCGFCDERWCGALPVYSGQTAVGFVSWCYLSSAELHVGVLTLIFLWDLWEPKIDVGARMPSSMQALYAASGMSVLGAGSWLAGAGLKTTAFKQEQRHPGKDSL